MSQAKRLGVVLAVNLAMVLVLLIAGVLSQSLGVLAAGVDYLGDALGTGLALVAVELRRRRDGHHRATALAALVNSGLLLAVTTAVVAEAVYRLAAGAPEVHGVVVVMVSVVAAAAMIACALILGDVSGDLSLQSVVLDSVADAAAALGVAISGAIILITGGHYWVDSAVALAIAVVVAYHALGLAGAALREAREVPAGL
jgi:cobalt-zinc-cadmium efflux system protein